MKSKIKKTNKLDYRWLHESHHTPGIIPGIKKVLSKINTKKLNHIDIGCGNGFITKKISDNFKATIGIDLSKEGIAFANKKKNKKKIKFYNKNTSFFIKNRKKFDFVTSIEVIEHQYDPFKFMSEIEKVTKKNGFAMITTPFHGYFKNLLISLLGLTDSHVNVLWKHGHIKFFSVKSLKKLIERYNFEIIDINFAGRFYPLSSSMIFLLKKK
tara:strand:- start:505 stop:1140 length:636 start_codon:yes stop_codon:yes gene_type:complete